MAANTEHVIVASPIAQWLRSQGVAAESPCLQVYPDGSISWKESLQKEGPAQNFSFEIARIKTMLAQYPGGIYSSRYRFLKSMGGGPKIALRSMVFYPRSWDWIGSKPELGLLLYPGLGTSYSRAEEKIESLTVRIELQKNYSTLIADELFHVVHHWYTRIGSSGVLGEGGVVWTDPVLKYHKKNAGFALDARGSGMLTLTSLHLAILNWAGQKHRPLAMIELASQINILELSEAEAASLPQPEKRG